MTLLIFDNFTATPILREITFSSIQTVKKCHLWQFGRRWTLNFGTFGTWKLLRFTKNLNSEPLKLQKNNIFWPFEFANIWFHLKSEWRWNYQIFTKSSLNFTFWKFLSHSATRTNIHQNVSCLFTFILFFSYRVILYSKPTITANTWLWWPRF